MSDILGGVSRRTLAVELVGVGIVVAAVWFAGAWIADPPDATCGSVFRPDLWWGIDGRCSTTMALRLAVAIGIGALGCLVLLFAASHRAVLAERVAAVGLVVAAAALVVNEAVRDGGLLM